MTFETKLQPLIDKQSRSYHLNDNVRSLLQAKHDYYDLIKLFSWFRNVSISIEENKVTVKTPDTFHREAIQARYGAMLSNFYKREVKIT